MRLLFERRGWTPWLVALCMRRPTPLSTMTSSQVNSTRGLTWAACRRTNNKSILAVMQQKSTHAQKHAGLVSNLPC